MVDQQQQDAKSQLDNSVVGDSESGAHPTASTSPNGSNGIDTSEIKRVRLIVNPISGDGEPNSMKLPEIVTALEAAGLRADLAFTQEGESPSAVAERAVAEGYHLVVVAGGDGTVSAVARGLIHTSVPLGIIPIGTYNNIARSLNLPNDVTQACEVIAQGTIQTIDVGCANGQNYFFEAAGIGLDAALFPLGEAIKGGRWGRMFQAARLAWGYRPERLCLEFDRPISEARQIQPKVQRRLLRRRKLKTRHEFCFSALLIVVANGPYYGSSFTVAPGAIVDDGLLTISVFRGFSKWELVRHFWSISRGQYHYNPKIETYTVAEVTVKSKAHLPVHVDGQPIGTTPVTLKIAKQALKVIVPTEDSPTYQRQDDPNPPVVLPVESDKSE
jgi:diacylglycerol kinase (ATP)